MVQKYLVFRAGKYVRVSNRYINSDIHGRAGYLSIVHILAKFDLMRIVIYFPLKYL